MWKPKRDGKTQSRSQRSLIRKTNSKKINFKAIFFWFPWMKMENSEQALLTKSKSQTCRRWVTLCQSGYCEIPASNVRASAEVTDHIPQPRKTNAIPAKGEEQNWIKLQGSAAPIYSKLPRNRRIWLPPVHTARPASAWPWALSPPLANRNLSK